MEKSLKGAAVSDHLSLIFTWCGFSRSPFPFLHLVRLFWKISLRCGRSKSPFSFLHLVQLLQITFPLPSLGAAVLEKSLKGAAVLYHLSFFFIWYSFSRSLFPFLHLVRLFLKNLSRVRPFSLLLNGSPLFFPYSVFSHL